MLSGPVAEGFVERLLESKLDRLVIWVAILAAAVVVAVYVIRKVRAESVQQEPTANELMSKFREVHSQGGLSDAEFRTIKTNLAAKLQDELRDNGQTGCDE